MKLGILSAHYGCVSDKILDRLLCSLHFRNIEIVCGDADDLGKPVWNWCERRGLPHTCIQPVLTLCGGYLPPACCDEAFVRRCDLVVLFWDGCSMNGRDAAALCKINGTPCAVAQPPAVPCAWRELRWFPGQVPCHIRKGESCER